MADYSGRPAFTATPHAEPGEVPTRPWRMITLTYLRGHQLVLVYTDPPADSGELPELMWRLQTAGARYGFTISVTDADAFTTQAPPIRAWSLRPKAGNW